MSLGTATADAGAARPTSPAVPRLAVVVTLAAFLSCLGQGRSIIGDGDTFLHVAAGQWMRGHMSVPDRDPFSGGLPDAPWVPFEWLSQVVLSLVWDGSGAQGLVLLSAAAFALTLGILAWRIGRHLEPVHVLLVVAVAGSLYAFHLLARPHILAMPFALVWTIGLDEASRRGRAPSFALALVMLAWANLHGSYVLGLGIAGLLGIEAIVAAPHATRWDVARQWALFGAVALAAALATPNGIDGLILPFALKGMSTVSQILEWQSPDFRALPIFQGLVLALVGLPFALGLRLPAFRVALILVLLHLSLEAVRHIDFLALLGPILVAPFLGPQIAARRTVQAGNDRMRLLLGASAGAPLLGLCLAMAIAGAALFARTPLVPDDGPTRPVSALEAARMARLGGKVLNTYAFGSWMIHDGWRPFIDGRMDMYGADFYQAYDNAMVRPWVALQPLLDAHGIRWTILKTGSDAALRLDELSGWRRIYRDPVATIHIRDP